MKTLGRLLLTVSACSLTYPARAADPDIVPPTVVSTNPAPNSAVPALRQVEVAFSEPVAGVDCG